ncbi:MAG: nicotinamide mononucleotide transporter [Armatimonadetes bacterium]|nr:hypothetical protein [Armatimonadota bacterium]MBS1700946.1 nicotinamide mononucleotide transporter [Armatimonadota bacterium]MBS1727195.1 nicotinamide mononucleotide transporter [Armatimonadota bacterium]
MQRPIKFVELALVLVVSTAVGVFCKLHWPDSSGWPEVWAFVIGAVAVYLQTIEHILSWPTWMLCVAIYAYVFHQASFFADRDLQVLYFVLSIHGWMSWQKGKGREEKLKVNRLKPVYWIPVLAAIGLGTAAYYPYLVSAKDAAPFWDGLLTSGSVVTQVLLNRKVYENWALWVLIDGIYVPLYIWRGLHATAILYFVFFLLAIWGWVAWHRSLREQLQAA